MKSLKLLAVLVSAFALSACGGGGGDAGTSAFGGNGSSTGGTGTDTSATSATIALALSSSTVTAASPATVSVTVRNAAGVAVSDKVVSFTTTAGLGTFSAATALTNAAGVATVALYPAANATTGADTIVASIDVDGTAVKATRGFQLTATQVTISSFTSGVSGALSANGQANLSLTVAGAAAGTPVSVSLTSVCLTKNKTTLTPATATSTNGSFSFTYRDLGCGATDAQDIIQATVVGGAATQSLTLPLTSPAVNSITFTSASPETIYLRGSGFTESSTVTFQVVDSLNNPLPGRSVTLEATTLAGGLTLDGGAVAVTKVSDSNGYVTALINSGTVPTPVRVRATLGGISTVSSSLSIAVGLPSQLNFSFAQATRNIEGYDIDGTANTYSIIASDRLGNPVPAGTAINFVTEGGQIEASKQIALTGGLARASANYVSASPKPADGRITVVAYALGEESFLDVNGNNIFDPATEAFQDLGNVYIDRAFDGSYDNVTDQYISLSLNGNAACAAIDPAKDPLNLLGSSLAIPSIGGTCTGDWGQAYVRKAVETVLSTSSAGPLWRTWAANATLANDCSVRNLRINAAGGTNDFYVLGGTLKVTDMSGTFSIYASDANPVRLNPMAAGTTISVTGSTDVSATLLAGSPVANTSDATAANISYEIATGKTGGTVTVNFTSPGGLVTSVPITVTTSTARPDCTL